MADIALDAQISPDDSALAGASLLFSYLWKEAWSHSDATQEGDAEALHDMRVNLRRLRTAMSNFEGPKTEPLFSKSLRQEIRGARADIGDLGDKLGMVRDFDVLEDTVRQYVKKQLKSDIEDAPGLHELLETLHHERKDAFKPMQKALKKADKEGELHEEFGRWALGIPAVKASDISFRDAARTVLKRRLEEVFSHADSLDPGAHTEEQHELRKSLRRVRYTLETMSVSYDKPIKSYVKTLVGLQDTLGEMQDIAVLLETTKRVFKGEVPEDVRLFNEYGDRKRAELLEATRASWAKTKAKGFWDELRGLHLQLPTVVEGL